ncbi:uncharacterized protein LOC118240138 [Electrophorus electricus]|uniref:uncharacterized protein LOC118240138 n=1 Tax=Electrophorus electricus TaxID=8005 RepID=UPI0015D01B45|nr:uncharacterized protein LOC118240138 [Electrophorus electricus]
MALFFQGPGRVVLTMVFGLLLGLAGGYLMGAMVMDVIDTLSSLRSTPLTPLECCTGLESLSVVTACVAALGLTVAMLASLITAVVAEEVVSNFLKPGDEGPGGVVLAAMGLMTLLPLTVIAAFMGALMERIVVAMGLVTVLGAQMGFSLALSLLVCAVRSLFPGASDLFLFPWMLFYLPAAGMCAGLCGSGMLEGSEIALFFFFSFLALFLGFAGLGGMSMPASVLLASTLIFRTVLEEDGEVLRSLWSEETGQSSWLLLRAVFLAVLSMLLCETAAGSTLLSVAGTARDGKTSACAAAVGALLLLATRRSSRVLGVGGTLGALLGVAGAVGVALTAAGDAMVARDAGRLGQKGSPVGKVAATIGAALGAFLYTAPPDMYFGVFVALCAAAVTGVLSSFRQCVCDDQLLVQCSGLQLRSFPHGLPLTTRHLILFNNRLAQLAALDMSDLSDLVYLDGDIREDVQDSAQAGLPGPLLQPQRIEERVNLTDNTALSKIHSRAFSGNVALQVLDVSSNHLSTRYGVAVGAAVRGCAMPPAFFVAIGFATFTAGTVLVWTTGMLITLCRRYGRRGENSRERAERVKDRVKKMVVNPCDWEVAA